MFLILCLLILWILLCPIKFTKQEVAESYGVCRKTLGKWVRYCGKNVSLEKWKGIRKLSAFDVLIIHDVFGCPDDQKPMTKGEIIENCDTYYHTLQDNIALNFKKLGINKVVYDKLDVFPPKLSSKMVEVMG